MADARKPIYCLADSQALFWRPESGHEPYLANILGHCATPEPKAAYIGASNGDDDDAYSIFTAAMDLVGIRDRRLITASFSEDEQAFLREAELIVLAGGDPVQGWRAFQRTGMESVIRQGYMDGAVLIGVSAGAVQLGWGMDGGSGQRVNGSSKNPARTDKENLVTGFQLIPAMIAAHEEEYDWAPLWQLVTGTESGVRGLGIPSGGALAYYAEGSIEPVRRPVYEIAFDDDTHGWRATWLFPDDPEAPATSAGSANPRR